MRIAPIGHVFKHVVLSLVLLFGKVIESLEGQSLAKRTTLLAVDFEV